MKKYAYRYLRIDPATEEESPLASCPDCGHDLTREGGVVVVLSDGEENVWEQPSRLLVDGTLDDPRGTLAAGLHAGTLCGGCREQFLNMGGRCDEEVLRSWGTTEIDCPCCGETIRVGVAAEKAEPGG